MTVARTITDVQADIDKLQGVWSAASQQYVARRAALAAEVDSYVAAHQSAADSHTAEIKAALALKNTLVPVAAAAETAGSELNSFLLTTPWYKRLVGFFQRNWRWVVYGVGVAGIGYVILHVHK